MAVSKIIKNICEEITISLNRTVGNKMKIFAQIKCYHRNLKSSNWHITERGNKTSGQI